MFSLKRARPALMLAAILAAAFVLIGCTGAPIAGWSSPTVANQTVYFGALNGKVYAVGASDGAIKWEFPRDRSLGPLYSTPTLSDTAVYFGASDKKLYALDSATGNPKAGWPDVTTGDAIIPSPLVSGNTVYVGSNDHKVYALDAQTGQPRWNAPFTTGAAIWADLTLAEGTLYVASLDHKLYALDPQTGQLKWSFNAGDKDNGGGIIVTKPAVFNGRVYIGSLKKLFALNVTDGTLAWASEASNWIWSNPSIVDGVIYFGALDGSVYALNAANGDPKWAAPFKARDAVRSAIVIDGGTAYLGSDDLNVYALDAATGAKKWSYATAGRIVSSPFVANGIVYIPSHDQKFYALDAANGNPKWVLDTTSGKLVSPTAAK